MAFLNKSNIYAKSRNIRQGKINHPNVRNTLKKTPLLDTGS